MNDADAGWGLSLVDLALSRAVDAWLAGDLEAADAWWTIAARTVRSAWQA